MDTRVAFVYSLFLFFLCVESDPRQLGVQPVAECCWIVALSLIGPAPLSSPRGSQLEQNSNNNNTKRENRTEEHRIIHSKRR
ncbi:hypothetical protein GQ42DRAFT_32230 [Ramicandelaber brevisporus]|nr:hypothetical protein GQ42DRAFT_32230 [Ramicandelaber brevisporus]